MTEYVIRFVLGGAVVSSFAIIGDVLRPKSFAGLFGAAPSVALVSLGLAASLHGPDYVSLQASTMLAGAAALLGFSFITCRMIKRWNATAMKATVIALPVWFIIAFGLYVGLTCWLASRSLR